MSDRIVTVSDEDGIEVVLIDEADPLISIDAAPTNLEILDDSIVITLADPPVASVTVVEDSITVKTLLEQGPPGPQGPQGPSGSPDISKTLVYNGDGTLASVTTAQGSKTMGYSSGKLVQVNGTGIYPSKTFGYTGEQLTAVTVA